MAKAKSNFIDEISHLNSECPKCQTVNTPETYFKDKNKHSQALSAYESKLKELESRKEKLKTAREAAYNTMLTNVKSVNIGFIAERLFPALPAFRFDHNDCRSTGGDPIDYVVFEGLSARNTVNFIHFVDVKTGNARLSPRQEEIKKVINDKNVKFRTY